MNQTAKEDQMNRKKLETEIQGCKVTMYFAEEPNLEVASHIKLALLGTVIPEKENNQNS